MTKRDKYKDNNKQSKGVCTFQTPPESDITNSDSDSLWRSPSKLKEEVQTIIDIMGPAMSPKFTYNTSSEADNEESVFSNSKLSSINLKDSYCCNDDVDKAELPSKDNDQQDPEDTTISADLNVTSNSATVDENTEPKTNFQHDEEAVKHFICPPPLLPANVVVNSECMCPQIAKYLQAGDEFLSPSHHQCICPSDIPRGLINQDTLQNKPSSLGKQLSNVVCWLKNKVPTNQKNHEETPCCQYYKMDVKRKRGDNKSPPRRVVFKLIKGMPPKEHQHGARYISPSCSPSKYAKNVVIEPEDSPVKDRPFDHNDFTNSPGGCAKPRAFLERATYPDDQKTRVDVYYFDHGCFSHYRTTDAPPMLHSEEVAMRTEKHTTKFWAEIFGGIHIGISFVTSFILQFFRFILYSIFRPLTIGLVQLASDYFFKPFLATVFNGIVQPVLIFIFNIAASIRDLCNPVAEGVGYFLREFAVLLGSIRLVEVNRRRCERVPEARCDEQLTAKKNKTVC
ncbi:hypothetical protein GWI33_002715 [Rhynchophorus ferrugineus]|uniref:Uncharacterized protein n=1 Tax=Rhynchophorus ferrugineus TaxID=354439 RepID=A0A834MFI7_RHYFE|nr:hypothetical protein GWI33_002715 [Rhynchophorus ferrugineus]